MLDFVNLKQILFFMKTFNWKNKYFIKLGLLSKFIDIIQPLREARLNGFQSLYQMLLIKLMRQIITFTS